MTDGVTVTYFLPASYGR